MSTTVRKSSGPGGRWWIAILLALLVAAVVLGAIFIPKLTKKSASPTATGQVVVVTNTPGTGDNADSSGPTATAGTGTGGTGQTGSTPLPNATPVPTVTGLKLGMITRPQAQVAKIQTGADNGDPTYTPYLDPRQVVLKTLPAYGFTGGFTITNPAQASPSPTPHIGADNRNLIRFLVSYKGATYTVAVAQRGTQGPKGIWVIVTIVQGNQLLK